MRCTYRSSTDLQSLLDVIEWAIDGDTKQFSTGFGELFEPSAREPVRDIFHLRQDYQPGVTGIRGFGDKRIGSVSTRNLPGTKELSRCSSALSAVCKNLSSWDLMSIPYVISMTRAPVTLRIGSKCGTCDDDRARKNQQSDVTHEIVGSFSETREKAESIFVDIIIKPRYRIRVQELVKEPATSSPLVSVTKQDKIPREHIHALSWRLPKEEATIQMAYSSGIGMGG